MILKSYIVEKNIGILRGYKATLIHGENNGIKDDIKETIKDQNKDSEVITFFESDILKNNFLYENIVNQSLFAERKIIFIHQASDKILNHITECLEKINKNIQMYVFSENLEKKSKLRSCFEKDKELAIFPCYEDNERTLITYVDKELKDFKGISGEIINLIINNSNMDRRIIKSELIKIKVFFMGKKINKEQILEILNINSSGSFDIIRDKALTGEKEKINKLLSKTQILNEEVFFYLNNLNYRIMRLYEIMQQSENNKNNYEKIIEALKPPIFWKDKPIMLQQLKKWSLKELEKIMSKIQEAETLMKKNSYLQNSVVIKDLIIKVTNVASKTY